MRIGRERQQAALAPSAGLEGTGRCCTVVTLTPSRMSYDENLHTMKFAAQLSDIKTKPQKVIRGCALRQHSTEFSSVPFMRFCDDALAHALVF